MDNVLIFYNIRAWDGRDQMVIDFGFRNFKLRSSFLLVDGYDN